MGPEQLIEGLLDDGAKAFLGFLDRFVLVGPDRDTDAYRFLVLGLGVWPRLLSAHSPIII